MNGHLVKDEIVQEEKEIHFRAKSSCSAERGEKSRKSWEEEVG